MENNIQSGVFSEQVLQEIDKEITDNYLARGGRIRTIMGLKKALGEYPLPSIEDYVSELCDRTIDELDCIERGLTQQLRHKNDMD